MKKSNTYRDNGSYKNSDETWREGHKLIVLADQSLDRSLAKLQETREIKDQTFSTLNKQDRKIEKAEKCMDGTHKNLDESDKTLRTTKSIFGGVVNFFKSDKSKKRTKREELPVSKKEDEKKQQKYHSSTPLIFESRNPDAQSINTRSTEMDQKIDIIEGVISEYKQDAIKLGERLDDQNQRLRALSNDTDFANEREISAIHKTRNI